MNHAPRRSSVLMTLVCVAILALLATTACNGSPTEGSGGSNGSVEASPSQESTPGPHSRVAVFFVDDAVIVPVMREVASGDLDAVVAALLAGPTEADRGALGAQLTTEIPSDTKVTSVSRDGTQVTVNVTEPFIADGGSLGIRLRLAQLVYTLTDLGDIEQVLLTVGGEPVRMVGDGLEIENPLTREQYTGTVPDVLIESPLPGDSVGSPMIVSGTTSVPDTEFILRLADADDTVVSERLVTSDAESGAFGVEVEYEGARPGLGSLYALSPDEDILMGVSVNLE